VWPVGGENYISQYYWSGHRAIDIAASEGTPVIAAVSGTVVMAGWRSTEGGGNVIWVMDGTKLYTTYNHLSRWSVRVGQRISAGQRIGSIGMTGIATGPHLHFEVWLGPPWGLGSTANAVNPCAYLAGC
jgi:murein DD-endopeptidase MepM/ murein hydrolase activator NlpD